MGKTLIKLKKKPSKVSKTKRLPKKRQMIFDQFHLNRIMWVQSKLVQENFDLSNFMNLVVKQILKLTPATGAVIELAEQGNMIYRAATGSIAKYIGLLLPIEDSISGLCVKTHKILNSQDTECDKRVNQEACQKVKARSLVVAPLFYQGKPVGVLKIISKKPHAFNEIDVHTLKIMANLIASGIAQKLYFEQLISQTNKLKEVEERLHLLVESIQDYAIFMLDPNGYIKTWNSGARHMLGFSEEEIVGQRFEIFYPAQTVEASRPQSLLHIARGKGRLEKEGLRIKKNGESFWVNEIITSLYDTREKFCGFAVILRDLTQSKKVESLQNEFISVVNHELRTPLTSIRGALGLLQVGDFPQNTKKLLNIANKNSERLSRLINDILDIQKIDDNKMQFNIKPLNIKQMIHESILSNHMYAKNFEVNLVADMPNENFIVNMDADRFLQIMANLISNAIKYSPKHGEILITLNKHANSARISVVDQGPGIPQEFQSRIFQKFAQANASVTREFTGTGLGLNITKMLIEKLGGKIDFSSSENGSTFYFDLPILKVTK